MSETGRQEGHDIGKDMTTWLQNMPEIEKPKASLRLRRLLGKILQKGDTPLAVKLGGLVAAHGLQAPGLHYPRGLGHAERWSPLLCPSSVGALREPRLSSRISRIGFGDQKLSDQTKLTTAGIIREFDMYESRICESLSRATLFYSWQRTFPKKP